MKRYRFVWVSLLVACVLALAACGGSTDKAREDAAARERAESAQGEGKDADASEQAEAVPEDPAQKFVGIWRLACFESEGIRMVGDFTAILGSDNGMQLDVKEDGTGTATFGKDATDFTWELMGDDQIKIIVTHVVEEEAADTDEEGDDEADSPLHQSELHMAYEDGVLTTEWSDGEMTAVLMLTLSGLMDDEPEIDVSKATPVTSLDALVGTWHLTAVKSMGATMYGSAEDLGKLYGGAEYTVLEVGEDGASKVLGQDAQCVVNDEEAVFDFDYYIMSVKQLDGNIVLDLSDLLETEVVLVFTK